MDFDGMSIAEHANGTRTSGLDTGLHSSGIVLWLSKPVDPKACLPLCNYLAFWSSFKWWKDAK